MSNTDFKYTFRKCVRFQKENGRKYAGYIKGKEYLQIESKYLQCSDMTRVCHFKHQKKEPLLAPFALFSTESIDLQRL